MIRGGASCSFGLWDSGARFGGSVLQICLGALFGCSVLQNCFAASVLLIRFDESFLISYW